MSGHLYIVAAPSGAGKTTLVRLLLENDPGIRLSISYTTRAPRPGEQNGREYNFVSQEVFLSMAERGEFIEWAEVHGNSYGTSRIWIEAEMAKGDDVLLEIDWQGAQQVKKLFPAAIGIFVLPPSMDELARRLNRRATDSTEVIAARLAAAHAEMRHVIEFDYVIINNELPLALADMLSIVHASRLGLRTQRARHAALFNHLI